MGKGRFKAYITGEDGSVMKVSLARPLSETRAKALGSDMHTRAGAEALAARKAERRVKQSLRMLRGLPGFIAVAED